MNSQFCSSDKPLPYQLGSAAYSHFLHFELPVPSELWGKPWICFLFLPWLCTTDGSRKQLVSSSNTSAVPAWIFILTFTLDSFSAMIRFSDYNVSFHQKSLCDLTGSIWGFEQLGVQQLWHGSGALVLGSSSWQWNFLSRLYHKDQGKLFDFYDPGQTFWLASVPVWNMEIILSGLLRCFHI